MKNRKMRQEKRIIAVLLSAAIAFTGISIPQDTGAAVNRDKPWLISAGRPAYASSVNGGDVASYATDGKLGTQWGAAADIRNQWINIDLGDVAEISSVELDWQNNAVYGVDYELFVSDDELNWKSVYQQKQGTGGEIANVLKDDGSVDYSYYKEVINGLSGKGRYIRLKVYTSKSQSERSEEQGGYGASVREFKVYGKGGVVEPESDAVDLAYKKPVTVSSFAEPWWSSSPLDGSLGVDNNYDTYWLSKEGEKEWFQIDLLDTYTIGRVFLQWQVEFGRMYEIQTSADGKNWTTAYRNLKGVGEDETITMYQPNTRYIRMQGIAMGRGSGYSIREMQVFAYEEGDPKENQNLPELPTAQTVQVGSGSYLIDDAGKKQPREPKYITANVTTPIPSNDWWTSIVYTRLSDTMPSLPYVSKYEDTGLSFYYADQLYTRTEQGGQGTDSKYFDLTLTSSDIKRTPAAKVDGYGDWSVNVVYSDDDTEKMKTTFIKGSPFLYNTFLRPDTVELSVHDLVKFFDDNNQQILTKDGDSITADHLGIEAHNISETPEDEDRDQYHFYGIYAPENTVFTRVGNKLKISLGSGENYLNVGVLEAESVLPEMYKSAYTVVTDTTVTYDYEDATSLMTTKYTCTVEQKRSGNGFKNTTWMCLMPHQWKYSKAELNGKTYSSARGTLKVHEGNEFSYSLPFHGVIPTFTEPLESAGYSREQMEDYLEMFKESALKDYWVADPYWQGKKSHPIVMGILIAEQLGDYETRDELVSVLRKILENWLTYSGDEEYPYYLYYSTSWGALSGDGGDHGMAINLSDHHFLWAYFIYPAAILASYDPQFVEEYGDMLEMLIRDCMNPDKDDELFPFMRNFDPYEGHSWAGGYGDNNSGNNQESASEATFSWAGLYLWGLVTGQEKYEEAGIWGYTSEINAIEQYWFDYDDTNWDEDYTVPYTGMVWGTGYTNGTYFSGNPCCIMGIHLLPVTPAITYMGYDSNKAAEIYTQYEQVQKEYQEKVTARGDEDPEGWFHILWPYLSLGNPQEAEKRFNADIAAHFTKKEDGSISYTDGKLPVDEMFNTYWFIENMCAKGTVATDIWSDNYTSYEVFKKDGVYTATVWNPFDKAITVSFCNAQGKTGEVKVAAHTTVSVNPFTVTDKSTEEVPTVEPVDKRLGVPGVIEAEDYYTNFGVMPSTHETEGTYMGWIDDGDSLVYKIDAEETARYQVEYRVIRTTEEKTADIELLSNLSGKEVLSETKMDVPADNQWHTVKGTITLTAGEQDLSVRFKTGGININWLKIYKEGSTPPAAATDDVTKADLSSNPVLTIVKATASNEVNGNTADKAVDKDYESRWESEATDPQWLMLDLGSVQQIGGIKIYWEGAAAKNYEIQVSEDGDKWSTAFTRVNGNGGRDNGDEYRSTGLESILFDKLMTGRYVRIYGTERLTGYGYSIFETEVYGKKENQKQELLAPEVTLTKTGERAIQVKWNPVEGAQKYKIYRKAVIGTSTVIGAVKLYQTTSDTEFLDQNLANGTYSYWVVAVPAETDPDYQESAKSADLNSITIAGVTEPVTEEPSTEEPATEEPATEQPSTEQPTTEQPSTEQPATETPSTEQPQQDKKVSKITLNKTKLSVAKGKKSTLKAVVAPKTAKVKTVKWSSSNPKVAQVDQKGVVTGKSYGTAVITATASDTGKVKASCKVSVGYKLTYTLNGGKNSAKNPGSYYKEKVKLADPIRKGYTFKGWFTDKKCTKSIEVIKSSSKKDYKLYAKWKKIKVGACEWEDLTAPKPGKVKVQVSKVKNASGYEVILAKDKKFQKVKKVISSQKAGSVIKMKAGTYYVKIRAYQKDSAGKKVYGDYSKVKTIKIK